MKQIIIILTLFLIGCQPTVIDKECPICECPSKQTPILTQEDNYLYVYFINVGQGDSALIHYKDYDVLIDCGKNTAGPIVKDFLKSKKISQIDYLIITHPDSDHLGGCDDILKSFNVTTVITNGQISTTESYNEVIREIDTEQSIIASKGMGYSLLDASLSILQANNGFGDDNQNSIVAKLTYNNLSFLFTGDCDKECENLLLDKDIQSTILKIAHHGTKFGTSLKLLETVKPKIAIISVGENSYGHPSEEVLDRLDQEGITTYRTDISGTIEIKTDGYTYGYSNSI